MNKYYFSFGQAHVHRVNGVTLDADCLLEVEAEDYGAARQRVVDAIGRKWSMQYEDAGPDRLQYFPRGVVRVLGLSKPIEVHDA